MAAPQTKLDVLMVIKLDEMANVAACTALRASWPARPRWIPKMVLGRLDQLSGASTVATSSSALPNNCSRRAADSRCCLSLINRQPCRGPLML